MSELSRRTLLGLIAATAAAPPAFARGVEDRKFIFVILRGAMDGLATLIPDAAEIDGYRGAIMPKVDERLDLGNGFRLHPSLTRMQTLYQSGEASFVHAAATPYRDRSHFDGQDALETLSPNGRDGWLNRALGALGEEGLAIGSAIPIALMGEAPASNWSPPMFRREPEALMDRLEGLYASDPAFMQALEMAQSMDMAAMTGKQGGRIGRASVALQALGKLMAQGDAPGVGMVSLNGWDTHANQPAALSRNLLELDKGLLALKKALGPGWAQTCIVICSEFGRTVRANGTRGTDHGTGGLMMLTGGAVKGGRIHGDWPGLKPAQLYENRDLAPANDIAGVLKGILRDHLGIDRAALDTRVLPGSARAMEGLV